MGNHARGLLALGGRGAIGPAGPQGNGHVVGAPDAGADGAAGKGDGLRAEPVDVVLAVHAHSRVLDAGDEADELGVVLAYVAARVRGREEDVGALAVEVGDGILVRVELGLVPRLDGVALPLLRVTDFLERAFVDERRALGIHEDEGAVGRGEARVKGAPAGALDGHEPRVVGAVLEGRLQRPAVHAADGPADDLQRAQAGDDDAQRNLPLARLLLARVVARADVGVLAGERVVELAGGTLLGGRRRLRQAQHDRHAAAELGVGQARRQEPCRAVERQRIAPAGFDK